MLYGRDDRPVDGVVFSMTLVVGTTRSNVLVGGDCGGTPGCTDPPADVALLRDHLVTLMGQISSYAGAGCSSW